MNQNQTLFIKVRFKILLTLQNKKILKVFKIYQTHNRIHFKIHPKINIISLVNIL